MPVLPATWASGIAPAVPVPPVTTPIISSVSSSAIFFDITRTGSASGRSFLLATIEVGSRTPSLAIVCATLAISSGVASTSPWPIALDPEVDFFADLGRDRRFGRFDFARRSAARRASAAS